MTFSSMVSHLILVRCRACHFNLVMHGAKGSFDNYVDKIRLVGVKNCPFVFRVKNVHADEVRWSKKCKTMPM